MDEFDYYDDEEYPVAEIEPLDYEPAPQYEPVAEPQSAPEDYSPEYAPVRQPKEQDRNDDIDALSKYEAAARLALESGQIPKDSFDAYSHLPTIFANERARLANDPTQTGRGLESLLEEARNTIAPTTEKPKPQQRQYRQPTAEEQLWQMYNAGMPGAGAQIVRLQGMKAQWSQSEERRLSRLQEQRSAIQEAMDRGEITDREAMELASSLDGKMSLLQAKRTMQTTMKEQEATKKMMQQNAAMQTMAGMDAIQRTQHFQQHSVKLEDGSTVYIDPLGKTHHFKGEKEKVFDVDKARMSAGREAYDKTEYARGTPQFRAEVEKGIALRRQQYLADKAQRDESRQQQAMPRQVISDVPAEEFMRQRGIQPQQSQPANDIEKLEVERKNRALEVLRQRGRLK